MVVGSGFASVSLLKRIDLDAYDVTVVSPRNHFVFTPLLPSTTVGTLEFRSVVEPIRTARPGVRFLLARAVGLDAAGKRLRCRAADPDRPGEPATEFDLAYDVLFLAPGAVNATFGVPGVAEHAHFLKEIADARRIRERVLACAERASVPGLDAAERDRLLHFVVVGGGPTGVELAAELADLLDHDVGPAFPELRGRTRVTLFEAGHHLLGAFDADLRRYAAEHFVRQGIELRLETPVSEVRADGLVLKSGEIVPAGLVAWSTGNAPTEFAKGLPFEKDRAGRVLVDPFLRVPGADGVFAAGDLAQSAARPVPQTAQVAMQQGKYLAKALNARAKGREPKPFRFKDLGMLAYIGEHEALADLPNAKGRGFATFLFWRSAYLTRLVSLKNKVLVVFDWAKALVFGRDLTKF